MEETARAATIGSQLKDVGPNELERLLGNILEQVELLNMLDNRLNVVSHRSPENATKEARERVPHIGFAADAVAQNNNKIRKLLEELAV